MSVQRLKQLLFGATAETTRKVMVRILDEAESASMIALQKHANELSVHPAGGMPWNYRDTLQRTDGPLTTAALRTQTRHTS